MITRLWKGWARADTAEAYDRHYRTEVPETLQGGGSAAATSRRTKSAEECRARGWPRR
jgi:hypothetical protein